MNLQPISPLILTLRLDQTTFEQANTLRQQYFPPARNIIPAHLTLFHALPGNQDIAITQQLQVLCSQTSTITLDLPKLRFLGNGISIEIEAPELVALRQTLAKTWSNWLSAQDRQGYRPHITIQNKVAAADAKRLYEQLMEGWQPMSGYGEGLQLWHYRGGPWELASEFFFSPEHDDSRKMST
jgi:2'-5' RNA ligase